MVAAELVLNDIATGTRNNDTIVLQPELILIIRGSTASNES